MTGPGASEEKLTVQLALDPLPASVHGLPVSVPGPLTVTVPVGVLAPEAAVSVTVAVQLLTSPGATVPGTHDNEVDVG